MPIDRFSEVITKDDLLAEAMTAYVRRFGDGAFPPNEHLTEISVDSEGATVRLTADDGESLTCRFPWLNLTAQVGEI